MTLGQMLKRLLVSEGGLWPDEADRVLESFDRRAKLHAEFLSRFPGFDLGLSVSHYGPIRTSLLRWAVQDAALRWLEQDKPDHEAIPKLKSILERGGEF